MTLINITTICKEQKLVLYNSLSNESSSGVTLSSDGTMSQLVYELLLLCSKETDAFILNLLSECIGELGAIDPAKISIFFNKSSKLTSIINDGFLLPWESTIMDFGMAMIEQQLVPCLKDLDLDIAIQDRISFAIQEILRILARRDRKSVV